MANKEIEFLREHIDERLDAIEKLINLSLLTAVMEQLGEVDQDGNKDSETLEEINSILCQYALELDKEEIYGDKTAIYIRSQEQMNLPKVRSVLALMQNNYQEFIPVFIFEKFNGKQRQKLLDERISFCVPNKELHIMG